MQQSQQPMDYFEPRSIDETLALLSEYGSRATVIAGGTDVLVDMKYKETPACLVNIKRIPNLAYIDDGDDGLRIGPLTTIQDLVDDARVRDGFAVLWDSARQFASLQIRNTATLGGNICRASPSGETLSPLLVLDALATVTGPEGTRTVPLSEFFIGPGQTVLGSNALLTEVTIPHAAAGKPGKYLKHAVRGAMDIAMVGVAVQINAGGTNGAAEARIGLTAVAPTPVRAREAEEAIHAGGLTTDAIARAARLAGEEARPITDHRAGADYRRWIVEALTRRGLTELSAATAGQGVHR